MKRVVLALAFVFITQSFRAEEIKDFGRDRLNKSPRHADWVDIKSGDRTIKAFVVYPESKSKTPVVLVISEIFGLTDWVRSLCDELAENGVIAIAPDLHGGQKFEDRNPWNATTLEWSVVSPTPLGNFGAHDPVVYRGAYEFSAQGSPVDFAAQNVPPVPSEPPLPTRLSASAGAKEN